MGRRGPAIQPGNACFEDFNVGDAAPELVIEEVTRTQIIRYAGAGGDFNPIHHDEEFARNAGLSGIFAMGMLTAGFLSHLVGDWLGLENIRRYAVRFTDRVWPGDHLVCSGRVTGSEAGCHTIEADLFVRNQHGKNVITGVVVAELPRRLSAD